MTEADLKAGLVYPRISEIREISAAVAVAVIRAAAEEDHVREDNALWRLRHGGAERLLRWVKKHMYNPFKYTPIAYRPPGIGE